MQSIAFCNRCRGMRVGWNRTYILHYLVCGGAIFRSIKILMCTGILILMVCAFPVTAGFVFSGPDALPMVASAAPAEDFVTVIDPAIGSIDHLLSFYRIEPRREPRESIRDFGGRLRWGDADPSADLGGDRRS
jgi:hypothetical protein